MKRALIAGVVLLGVLGAAVLAAGFLVLRREAARPRASQIAPLPPVAQPHRAPETHQGFLYGRITIVDGSTFEGRLRWGGDEEAFWGDGFNGFKDENPWAEYVPDERLRTRRAVKIFGVQVGERDTKIPLVRPFMGRLGDIVRIEARGDDVRVTLKNGTVFDLDRDRADDLADGVRVWDDDRGVEFLHERDIVSIDLLPTPPLVEAPYRLYGTVRTQQGDFTGFVQWDRDMCVGTDELVGGTTDGPRRVRFDNIQTIARDGPHGVRVTLLDGREILLSRGSHWNRGIYVDDPRYGRVLIDRDTFEHVEFGPGGSGPAYEDFPIGLPLMGRVTTRTGDRFNGRLVFDLDESETVETLDAPFERVTYTIPFGLIASIVPPAGPDSGDPHVTVILHRGEELQLERTGDLGDGNGGLLVFVDGRQRPEYVDWSDVQRIDLDPPAAMFPPVDGR